MAKWLKTVFSDDVGGRGDLGDRDLVEAALGEEAARGRGDRVAGGALLALAQALGGCFHREYIITVTVEVTVTVALSCSAMNTALHPPSRSTTSPSPTATSRPSAAFRSPSRRARSSASSAPTAPARARRSTCSARWPGPRPGRARVSGFDVVPQRDDVRRHIGLVFQDPTLDGYLTAEQNLRLHAELYGIDRGVIAARMDQMLEMVDLADRRDKPVMTFSGGMRRRLEIARGLMHSPRVLFLDEPTIGLDPQTRSSIWRYIRALQEAEGTTIFMTTHYMDEAELCDRIAIMDRGEIVVLDTPEALKASVGADRVVLGTADDDAAIAALQRPLRHRGRVAEGAVTFHVDVRRGVRPAAVRRARTSPSRRSPSRGRRSTTSSCATRARRSATPRRPAARITNRAMMRAMAGARPMSAAVADVVAVRVPRALVALGAAGGEDRLAARADPLRRRPRADRDVADPAAAVPVRAGLRAAVAVGRLHRTASTSRRSSSPGSSASRCCSRAMFSAASLVWDRELGFLREMMVAPVSRSSIIVGKCLGGAIVAASQGVIVLALAGFVHVPYDPAADPRRASACCCCWPSRSAAFGLLVAVTHQAGPDLHERDADVRDADVLPVRRALPRRRGCRPGSAC